MGEESVLASTEQTKLLFFVEDPLVVIGGAVVVVTGVMIGLYQLRKHLKNK